MVTGGRNTGRIGVIVSKEKHPGPGCFSLETCAWSLVVVTLAELESSCPRRSIPVPSTLFTSRTPTVTPSPLVKATYSSLVRVTSPTCPCPEARVSSFPSPRRETIGWQEKIKHLHPSSTNNKHLRFCA